MKSVGNAVACFPQSNIDYQRRIVMFKYLSILLIDPDAETHFDVSNWDRTNLVECLSMVVTSNYSVYFKFIKKGNQRF